MKENTNETRDELAAIGIGAMIVFIALILVAAVAAAVIIQTAEKLQQNAQTTGAETTDMLSSKVLVMSVMISDTDELYITFELAPGSADLLPSDVEWSIICADGADFGTFRAASTVGTQAQLNVGELLVAHTTYDIELTTADLTSCEPAADEDHTLLIQSKAGGFTFETLNYGSDVSTGAMVV
jgi:flagellin FlaB